MKLGLPRKDDDGLMHAIVKRRKLDDECKAVGKMNNNPLLDTRAYEIEFADDTTEVLTDNIIADNILAQVDEEGNHKIILYEIIDHRQNVNAIGKEDAFTKMLNGMKRRKMSTAGWQLCIQWKYGSTYRVALKDINISYPVELADYTKRMEMDDETVFAW